MIEDRPLTAFEVSEILGVHESAVYALKDKKLLMPKWKYNGESRKGYRWSIEDVKDYLRNCEISAVHNVPGDDVEIFVPINIKNLNAGKLNGCERICSE